MESHRSEAPSELHPASFFVGRAHELEEVLSGLTEAIAGRGRIYLLAGEPGIGKTRFAEELGAYARQRSVRVLRGRCWEGGGAPAYWPWRQVIRSYLREASPAELQAQMGVGAVDLAQILPEIRSVFPELPPLPSLDPEGARFRLFDATTEFFKNAASTQPLLVVLDDLHAADVPSLLLLQFMAGQLSNARMLVVGAYRDVELVPGHPLASTLIELAREPTTQPMALGGLTEPEIARFIELTTRTTPPQPLVAAVHAKTKGNPLFVGEVVRLLATEGRLIHEATAFRLGLPYGLREAISRRLRQLTEQCQRVLVLASVIGREFGLDALERVSGLRTADLLRVLDEAVAARILVEIPGTIGRLRFAHDLFRDSVYDELTPNKRADLHREVGETLERLYANKVEQHLAELAHHFTKAAPGGDVEKAIEYARRAGQWSVGQLAYEEAVRHFEMAVQLLDLRDTAGEIARCDLLLALGDAQYRGGDGPTARATFIQAADLARTLRLPDHLARAALGYGGRFVWARARGDRRLVNLLEEALEALGASDSPLRARVLARLAGALRDSPHRERREALGRQAVEMAQRVGDQSTRVYALSGLCAALWWLDNVDQRLDAADELRRFAEQVGDREMAFDAYTHRYLSFHEIGDLPAAQVAFDERDRLARELRQPAQLWNVAVARGAMALLAGRLDEAEAAIWQALRYGERAQSADAAVLFRVQLFCLRKEQGRLSEIESLLRRSVEQFSDNVVLRSMLASLWTELGQPTEARGILEGLAANDFTDWHVDNDGIFGLALLAEVIAFLNDSPRARRLHDLLLPYAHLNVVPGEVNLGSVSRYLGILATVASRFDDGVRHFEQALAMHTRMGTLGLAAHTQLDWARLMLRRDSSGDRNAARALLTQARQVAVDLKMRALEQKVGDLFGHFEAPAAAEQKLEEAQTRGTGQLGARVGLFRLEGEYWSVAYGGDVFRLKDSKGLRYIARLLREPGRELHVLDLTSAESALIHWARATTPELHPDAPGMHEGFGDAGEMLDPEARAAYRRRIADLEEDLEEATAWNDVERAARLREEKEFLARELALAVGIGGRPRRAASAAERARVNVTRAIKAALLRVQEHSPGLGYVLSAGIRTGFYCSYLPDPQQPVSWEL